MSGKKNKAERRKVIRQDPISLLQDGAEATQPTSAVPKRWPLLAIRVLATLGLSIGVYLAILHYRAGADGVIDSPLCGAGTVVNCNAVLGSPYARLFGVPIA